MNNVTKVSTACGIIVAQATVGKNHKFYTYKSNISVYLCYKITPVTLERGEDDGPCYHKSLVDCTY